MKDDGFLPISVALDQDAAAARPFIEKAGATHPSLVDSRHVVPELYGMINVPTVVWIDEDLRIVRPKHIEYGTDMFIAFHGRESAPHLDAVRRWVKTGEVALDPADADELIPTQQEQLARAEFQLAWHLHRRGRPEAAERHFLRAGELSPFDWTIRRAALPIRGLDPMGEPFIELYQAAEEAGRPNYQSWDRARARY